MTTFIDQTQILTVELQHLKHLNIQKEKKWLPIEILEYTLSPAI